MEAKYDQIGVDYQVSRKADSFITDRLLKHLQPQAEGVYLDIGCGTGNYTHEFQKRGFPFIGIDPSIAMLEKARQKNKSIDWKIGAVENIKLPNHSIDGIVAILTIHHWTDLDQGFSELSRVIKPNGRVVIFTSTPKQMKGYWLNHYFPRMLANAMVEMPSLEEIENAMSSSGMEITEIDRYFIQPDLQDNFLYCGKHRPELYFDQQIRKGISSFSSLANQEEVKQGLSKLRADIDSVKIDKIINSYENDYGDYLFVVGRKVGT